jgi:hypothetical protein
VVGHQLPGAACRIVDRIAVPRESESWRERHDPLEGGQVVAERVRPALRIEADRWGDPGKQVVAREQDAFAKERDVAVGVTGDVDDLPAPDPVALPDELRIGSRPDEGRVRVPLLDQVARDRLRDALRPEPGGDPVGPIGRPPNLPRLGRVELALDDVAARDGGSADGAADVIRVHVRHDDSRERPERPPPFLGVFETEPGVDEHRPVRVVDDVAVHVPRA